jgi:hypothetical protein
MVSYIVLLIDGRPTFEQQHDEVGRAAVDGMHEGGGAPLILHVHIHTSDQHGGARI